MANGRKTIKRIGGVIKGLSGNWRDLKMTKNEPDPEKEIYTSTAIAVFIGFFTTVPLMFQYVLWSVFSQDVPWYVDLLAGCAFARCRLFQVFALCVVLRHCDYAVPLFKSIKATIGY